MRWNDEGLLPARTGTGWAVWKGREIDCVGRREATRFFRAWNPTHALFAASPGLDRFVPPPACAALGASVLAGFRQRARWSIAVMCAGAVLFFLVSAVMSERFALGLAITMSAIAALGACDYCYALSSADGASDRARYFYWLRVDRGVRTGFVVWSVLFAAMGTVQWALVARLGLDATVESFGLIYAAARKGEVWRFATGPLFHASTAHFLNNAVSATFLGAMLWPDFKRKTIVLFVMANSFAAVAQIFFGDPGFDSFLGVSGGVFALYGFLIATSLRVRDFLPRGMPLLLFGIGVISALGAWLLSPNSGVVVHAAGFMIGAAAALLQTAPHRQALSTRPDSLS